MQQYGLVDFQVSTNLLLVVGKLRNYQIDDVIVLLWLVTTWHTATITMKWMVPRPVSAYAHFADISYNNNMSSNDCCSCSADGTARHKQIDYKRWIHFIQRFFFFFSNSFLFKVPTGYSKFGRQNILSKN